MSRQDHGSPNPDSITFDSGNLAHGVEVEGRTFHHLSVSVPQLGAESGTLQLDPNTCSLDVFGSPEACTKLATTNIPANFTPVARDGRRSVYDLIIPGAERSGLRFAILQSDAGIVTGRLLLLDQEQQTTRSVTLVPSRPLPAAPASLASATAASATDTFTGRSDRLSVDEALAKAVALAVTGLTPPGGADVQIDYEVTRLAGRVGGFAGQQILDLTLRATAEQA